MKKHPQERRPKARKRIQLGLIVTARMKAIIGQEAERTGRTQSQAAEAMLERLLALEQQLRDMRRDLDSIDIENLLMAMRRRGFTPVHGTKFGRVWVEPSVKFEQRSGFEPEMHDIPQSGIRPPEMPTSDHPNSTTPDQIEAKQPQIAEDLPAKAELSPPGNTESDPAKLPQSGFSDETMARLRAAVREVCWKRLACWAEEEARRGVN